MIVVLNPSFFYNSLASKDFQDIFLNEEVQIGYLVANNNDFFLSGITEDILLSANSVFIDDYVFNGLLEKKNISSLFISKNRKLQTISLVDFWESKFKMAAIFEANETIYYPKYLEDLKPKFIFHFFLRIIDILVCFVLLPLVLFILSVSVVVLLLVDGAPVFFIQDRVGLNSNVFELVKIRSMINSSNLDFTSIDDKRIFPFGKLLRTLKFDELPQFLSIFLGQMSIIGPRPERLDLHRDILKKIVYFDKRLLVRPGLTGWAQINAPTATPNDSLNKLKYDIYFIKNSSIFMIIQILFETILILLKRKSL
jgi:lipopolysaccharide/colanic/teichoic acid biosynthesis glycosyltransferase